MPRPYSADLRRRVLNALEQRPEKREEIARRFEISLSTLYTWQRQYRSDGRIEAKPHAGGQVGRLQGEVLVELVAQKKDRTLDELAALYREQTGQPISFSSVHRLLKARQVLRKK